MPFVASCSDLYQYFALLSAGCVFSCFSLCLWCLENSFGFGMGAVAGFCEYGKDLP